MQFDHEKRYLGSDNSVYNYVGYDPITESHIFSYEVDRGASFLTFDSFGQMTHNRSVHIVREIKPKHEIYVNIYKNEKGIHKYGISLYPINESAVVAQSKADNNSIVARVKIEYEEGQFDE